MTLPEGCGADVVSIVPSAKITGATKIEPRTKTEEMNNFKNFIY
jgi:hypothetical protein